MEDEIEIGPASPEEWEKFRALRLEALQTEPQAFGSSYEEEVAEPDSDWIERVQETLEPDGNILLFARHDDRLVGMIGAFFSQAPKSKHIATVWGVYVRQAFRGQGIGKRLMQAVLQELRGRPGILKVKLTVNTNQSAAIALYEQFGFKIVGKAEKDLKVGDTFYDEFFMEKFL